MIIYYHDVDVCKAINREHLNPRHLTEDLARRLGGMDKVPRLSPKVYATNNLEQVVEDNDFIFLSVTMDRLPEILNQIKPILEKKSTQHLLHFGDQGAHRERGHRNGSSPLPSSSATTSST